MRETVEVKCPLCGSDKPRPYAVERELRVCLCGECGLLYVNPRLSDGQLMEIYSKYYHTENHWDKYIDDHDLEKDGGKHTFTPFELWEKRYGQLWSQLSCALPESAEKIKTLDFGSGTSLWPRFAAGKGMETWAYDIADNVASKNAGESGVRWVVAPSLDESGLEAESFDLITMWDVIEHLTDPAGALETIKKYLKPGGVLFIQTPNAWWIKAKHRILSCLPKKKVAPMISKYGVFLPEQHLQYYSFGALARQLSKIGMGRTTQAFVDWSESSGGFKSVAAYRCVSLFAKLVHHLSFKTFCANIGLSVISVKE